MLKSPSELTVPQNIRPKENLFPESGRNFQWYGAGWRELISDLWFTTWNEAAHQGRTKCTFPLCTIACSDTQSPCLYNSPMPSSKGSSQLPHFSPILLPVLQMTSSLPRKGESEVSLGFQGNKDEDWWFEWKTIEFETDFLSRPSLGSFASG